MDEANSLTYYDLTFIATIIALLMNAELIWDIFSEEDDERGLIVRLKLEQRR